MLISLCTVCKNRSDHLKQTIIKNIHDNINDPDIEFILLDYNSEDDLEEWAKIHLADYIAEGIVTYYKTFEPRYFRRSHSRNMVFSLANGDLLCNVDADNYTGPLFSSYLKSFFKNRQNVFVCAGGFWDGILAPDVIGRICLKAKDFFEVGGYDESMTDYGFEDFDLINRLQLNNLLKETINERIYLKAIHHSQEQRITDEFPYKNIKSIYINYITPAISQVLYIFIDDNFSVGTLIKEKYMTGDRAPVFFSENKIDNIQLKEETWVKGVIQVADKGTLNLVINSSVIYNCIICPTENRLILKTENKQSIFYEIREQETIVLMLLIYSEVNNKAKMLQNFDQRNIKPNQKAIGSGTVYKNFNYTEPIRV